MGAARQQRAGSPRPRRESRLSAGCAGRRRPPCRRPASGAGEIRRASARSRRRPPPFPSPDAAPARAAPRRGAASRRYRRESTASGSTPIWREQREPARRAGGQHEARRAAGTSRSHARCERSECLLEAIGDAALGQIVGRHLDQHLVARQHADAVLAHLARGMGDDLVVVLELDAKSRVRQQFDDETRETRAILLSTSEPFYLRPACLTARRADPIRIPRKLRKPLICAASRPLRAPGRCSTSSRRKRRTANGMQPR